MSIELAILIALLLYIAHLRIKLWLDGKVIQSFQKSAIIVPKAEKKQDLGAIALIIAALALLLSIAQGR
ncbi:MAG TPA: hypothetical protein VFL17_23475 [Anaerolineae bacterium]|nr:hypothetical protein [Anaerolineae bacterium]